MKKEEMTLKEKTKKEFNKFFAQLYLGNSTIIITVCWVIGSVQNSVSASDKS